MTMMTQIVCRRCGTDKNLMDVWGDVRCLDCWGTKRLDPAVARTLVTEAQELEPTAGPWRITDPNHVGEDFTLADMGHNYEMNKVVVTTDIKNLTDYLQDGGPDEDAAWIVWCRNHWREIVSALELATVVDAPS